MPRLSLSWSLCLLSLCSLMSCNKQDPKVTAASPEFQQQDQKTAAAPAKDATPQVRTDANGKKIVDLNPKQAAQLADQFIAKGQLRDAHQILSKLIQLDPKSTDAYVKRAAIMADAKQLTQAIADMSKAIQLEPNNARFRNTRGYFHLSQNALPQAEQDFSDAIGADINFKEAYNNRGLVKIKLEKFKDAVKDFDEALKTDPKYLDALNNRGYALQKQELFDEAIASFSKAIEFSPKYLNAWHNRGQTYLKAKQAEKALADFNEALKQAPTNVVYLTSRADAYTALGKKAESQADHERVNWLTTLVALTQQAQQNPKQPAVWVARGRHLLKSNEYEPALVDFGRALQIAPENVEARCGRAAALLNTDKADEAIAECNTALKAGLLPMAISIRGDAYFKKGDFDRAIEDYATAKRMDSQVARAYSMRSEKFRAAGQVAKADADLEEAMRLDPAGVNRVRTVSGEVPATK